MPGQRIIKYTLEHYRKEGVSEEAFSKWFQEVHIPAGVPLMKKHGITKYAVHTRLPQAAAAFEAILKEFRPSWDVSQADLVLEYWVPDLKFVENLVADPEWNEKAVKNQEEWIDVNRSTVHIGYETVYLENGIVNV
ncbi:hypothetical protein F5Y13DRAFT_159665 [Hypoxylon sp. FL1857]|nr:hypothetical protein F5Y13DRAFT_159665 [Hypoxylon sp. FL1857]